MQHAKDFDFSQICFNSDSMQVLSVSNCNKHKLPLTRGPINFSVVMSDGKLSNRWGANINGKGDAYVYSRDNPNAEKVSLHASGQQHISIRSDIAESVGVKSRFGNIWSQPISDTEAIATFTLMFPPWGVGLEPKDTLKRIKKSELLIIGHIEKMVVVAFIIVDASRTMRVQIPHIVLGSLPLGRDKILHVITWKESQGDWKDHIRRHFPQAAHGLSDFGCGAGEYVLSFQGYRQPNSAFMMEVPVHYQNLESNTGHVVGVGPE